MITEEQLREFLQRMKLINDKALMMTGALSRLNVERILYLSNTRVKSEDMKLTNEAISDFKELLNDQSVGN